jgi:hypothetical protein
MSPQLKSYFFLVTSIVYGYEWPNNNGMEELTGSFMGNSNPAAGDFDRDTDFQRGKSSHRRLEAEENHEQRQKVTAVTAGSFSRGYKSGQLQTAHFGLRNFNYNDADDYRGRDRVGHYSHKVRVNKRSESLRLPQSEVSSQLNFVYDQFMK